MPTRLSLRSKGMLFYAPIPRWPTPRNGPIVKSQSNIRLRREGFNAKKAKSRAVQVVHGVAAVVGAGARELWSVVLQTDAGNRSVLLFFKAGMGLACVRRRHPVRSACWLASLLRGSCETFGPTCQHAERTGYRPCAFARPVPTLNRRAARFDCRRPFAKRPTTARVLLLVAKQTDISANVAAWTVDTPNGWDAGNEHAHNY